MIELKLLERQPNESVREYAYRILSENIMSLRLVPGMSMSEKEISDILSVSRTPVREAFIRLAQAGLLEILPQRGTYVSKIDTKQIAEFRFLRLTLERAIIELACQHFTTPWSTQLLQCLTDQSTVIHDSNSDQFFRLDNEMHRIIFSGCAKPHVWQIVQDANMNYIRARVLNVTSTESEMEILYEQHKKIVQAITEHDVQAGVDIITKHVNKVIGDVDLLKKQYPAYFQ